MGEEQFDRVQYLFLTALELPEDQRELWLIQQCGDDQALLQEVRTLLIHDSPADDPLEHPLEQAIDLDCTMPGSDANSNPSLGQECTLVNGDQFLSRLVDVGILSNDEVTAIEQDLSDDDPSELASQLVTEGKLTEYQATALLKGQPSLLIDKYLILDLIGMGGMGTVFKAIHRPMNRIVAFKMISKHLLASPDQLHRFQREVRVAGTLENVNIVRAYDADQSKGVHFLVMEYVRGENLAQTVRRDGPLAVERAVDCIRQAANGLRYAHRRGVVHRDIKPSNLMQTRDMLVKVLDLGLADIDDSYRQVQRNTIVSKENTNTRRLAKKYHTEFGAVLGTASFMAPEQSRDAGSADPRSDIYSLGCTLYFLLLGEPPYKGETSVDIIAQHCGSEIPSIRHGRPEVSHSVDAICRRMMAKRPGERFQSMGELIAAIEDCEIDPQEMKNDPHG
jgi:serine/threonine protein kinase